MGREMGDGDEEVGSGGEVLLCGVVPLLHFYSSYMATEDVAPRASRAMARLPEQSTEDAHWG